MTSRATTVQERRLWTSTRHISQHLHGRGELLAGLLVLAILVKQTAHVVDVVGVILGKLLQQRLHNDTRTQRSLENP